MGLQQYEVSAFATPGEEAKHNMNYWEFGDYFGIGAGAHGKSQPSEEWFVRNAPASRQIIWHEHVHATEHPFQTFIWSRVFDEWPPTQIRNLVHPFQRTGLDPVKFRAAHLMEADRLNLLTPERFQTSKLGWRHLNNILEMLI